MAAARAFCRRGSRNVGHHRHRAVGNYALRLLFDDGHNTGLYTWVLLYELGRDRERNWGPLPSSAAQKPARHKRRPRLEK